MRVLLVSVKLVEGWGLPAPGGTIGIRLTA
jgi:hypothetical protein